MHIFHDNYSNAFSAGCSMPRLFSEWPIIISIDTCLGTAPGMVKTRVVDMASPKLSVKPLSPRKNIPMLTRWFLS